MAFELDSIVFQRLAKLDVAFPVTNSLQERSFTLTSLEPNTGKNLKQNPAEHLGKCLSVPVPVKDVLCVRIYNSSGSLES